MSGENTILISLAKPKCNLNIWPEFQIQSDPRSDQVRPDCCDKSLSMTIVVIVKILCQSFTVTILHSHDTVTMSGLCMYQMTMLPCQKGISDFITRYCIVQPVIWCTIAIAIGLWNREGGRKNFLFSCAEAPQVNGSSGN